MDNQPQENLPANTPQPDYTPPMPEQLRRQIAAAEQMRADMATPTPAADETPPQQPPQPEATVPTAPPAEGEGQSWEQRFKSQQGRLEQALRNNQALAERLQAMDNQIATLKVKGAEEFKAAPAPAKPQLITPQEAEEYGEEFLTVVGKRAKEEYAPEFEQLASRLKRLEGQVEGVGTVLEKTQTKDIYQNLAEAVPNWREVNKSDEFKLWLQQPDGYSGRRRYDMLTEAFSRHEANRVVTFFQGISN